MTSHDIGDTKVVTAANSEVDGSEDNHHIKLYDPPSRSSHTLKWKCSHCKKYFANWTVFESEPCTPWKSE